MPIKVVYQVIYWGYIGIMEKKMETTIMGCMGIIGYVLVLYWENGKENGNYSSTLGIYSEAKLWRPGCFCHGSELTTGSHTVVSLNYCSQNG